MGNLIATDMTSEQKWKCHMVIHTAAALGATAAAAMAQAPGTDNVALVAFEVTMVISLGSVFGIQLTESAAKGKVAGYAGTLAGRGIFQFLIGWVPGLGNAANAVTAAGVIETLGWAVAHDFNNSRNRYI